MFQFEQRARQVGVRKPARSEKLSLWSGKRRHRTCRLLRRFGKNRMAKNREIILRKIQITFMYIKIKRVNRE